jgi:hypothetical protein
MKQHTPGPWAHTKSREHSNPDTARRDIVAESQFGPAFIAGDVSQFDAALISAAPELLSALEESRIALTFYRNWMALQTEGRTDYPFGIKTEDKARAAIAKAKGEA